MRSTVRHRGHTWPFAGGELGHSSGWAQASDAAALAESVRRTLRISGDGTNPVQWRMPAVQRPAPGPVRGRHPGCGPRGRAGSGPPPDPPRLCFRGAAPTGKHLPALPPRNAGPSWALPCGAGNCGRGCADSSLPPRRRPRSASVRQSAPRWHQCRPGAGSLRRARAECPGRVPAPRCRRRPGNTRRPPWTPRRGACGWPAGPRSGPGDAPARRRPRDACRWL